MQEAFIAGFVKTAVDLGYDDDTIARVFKRAMVNPQVSNMFNALPSGGNSIPPQDLQALSQAQQMALNPQQLPVLKQLLAQGQPQV